MDVTSKILFKHLLVTIHGEIPQELQQYFKDDRVFVPPTIEEVTLHLKELRIREAKQCAEKFVNFYEAKGWMIGKNKMKNWKSAINTWGFERNNLIL
jgi:hypothetical protein